MFKRELIHWYAPLILTALQIIPKLGRKKIMINGKPCGRNELIADYIRRNTGKVRSRKQVSSHIQVLKNMKKHDVECKYKTQAPYLQLRLI